MAKKDDDLVTVHLGGITLEDLHPSDAARLLARGYKRGPAELPTTTEDDDLANAERDARAIAVVSGDDPDKAASDAVALKKDQQKAELRRAGIAPKKSDEAEKANKPGK